MAIIIETGSGAANSESYISVVDADTYHSDRGNIAWATLTTAIKEQLLRKATEYMIQFYRYKWKGWRVNQVQALDWPRQGVYLDDYGYPVNNQYYGTYELLVANDIVPTEVSRACATLALMANSSDLAPNVERIESSVSIGNMSVTYSPAHTPHTQYRAVDLLLKPLLVDGGGAKLIRV